MPLLVMVFVMMKQILLNVIMMVDIVAQILTWLVIFFSNSKSRQQNTISLKIVGA